MHKNLEGLPTTFHEQITSLSLHSLHISKEISYRVPWRLIRSQEGISLGHLYI
jgi:hypothetical protein